MTETVEQPGVALLELTTEIVSAYVSHNAIGAADLTKLIAETHTALGLLGHPPWPDPVEPLKPAVPVKKSVTHDHIVCLEDGKTFKAIKRHLRTYHNLTPEEYREKWSLAADYPMVAPAYSARRSTLALQIGLGRKSAEPAPATPARKTLGLKFST